MKAFFLFLITIIFYTSVFAQEVSIVSDNVPNNEAMYYFHERKVARTSEGLLMVVWTTPKGEGGQINYSTYDNDFLTWSPAVVISSAAYQAKLPAIASDELGNIHACWQEQASSSGAFVIMYSKYSNGAWSTPVQVSLDATNSCEEASIEVDSHNNPWVVYNNDGAGSGLEYVYVVNSTDQGSTWSATATTISSLGTIGSSSTNARCTLSAGPDGKLVAIWHDGQPWDNGRREVYANQYDGTNWLGEVMISDTTTADRSDNWYPTVAVDNSANIYAIYHINDNTANKSRYMLLQKKAWAQDWSESVTSIIHSETAGDMLSTSAACDEDGVIHFAFRKDIPEDTTGLDGIYYMFSKDGGETWSEHLRLGRVNYDAGYVSVANRIRKAYGIDVAFRESATEFENDGSVLAIVYENIPYSLIATGVEDGNSLPEEFNLLTNYPNPFNPSTTIEYKIANSGNISLTVYNILGKEVKTIVNDFKVAGSYKATWNGTDSRNNKVASGVYFTRLKTDNGVKTIKMQLLK